MKPRQLSVTPQAARDFNAIIAWYRDELGAKAAAKAARTIQAGIRATTRISLSQAARPDLPEGYFRVIAKTHIVVFQADEHGARVVRILHAARDIATILESGDD